MATKKTTTPKAPKRITLTKAADIIAFAAEQSNIRESDRMRFSVTFKPITDPIWVHNGMIDDGAGDNMPSPILTAIVQNTARTGRIESSANGDGRIVMHIFDGDASDEYSWIWIAPEAIVSLSYVPPIPPRLVGTPIPASLKIDGLQCVLEATDENGLRGFKAGCNKVKNSEAIKALEWLASTLGYNVTINPAATLKPAKKRYVKRNKT